MNTAELDNTSVMQPTDRLMEISNSALRNGAITKQYILIECVRLERLISQLNLGYVTPPQLYKVDTAYMMNKKAPVYGTADSNGVITISKHYIGTRYISSLRETIIHELAHLSVGTEQNHNPAFKKRLRVFREAAAIPLDQVKVEGGLFYRDHKEAIKPSKYKLYAITECGTRIFHKYKERKQKLYTGFEESDMTATAGELKIVRFEYDRIEAK